MRIRTSIAISLIIILATVVSMFLFPQSKVQGDQNFVQREIPVVIKPLEANGEIVPVDIQCEPVYISRPDTLDGFTCVLINNTNKSIRASGVSYSIIYESNGKEERLSQVDVVDRFVHPDLSEVKKPLGPGDRQLVLSPGPIIQRDAVIKALELEPVYLEFSNGTTAGTDSNSRDLISKIRQGAARYKDTLRQKYVSQSESVEAILPLLREKFTGDDQNSWTIYQRVGANAYRRYLQDKYEKAGALGVREILDK